MLTDTTALLMSAALAFAMAFFAAAIRTRLWTVRGFGVAVGNRENMPEMKGLVGRADRAARNMTENLVMFVAVVAAVRFLHKQGPDADLGATIFFWARAAYWLAYLGGVTYVRTALWAVGVAGMFLMGFAALS